VTDAEREILAQRALRLRQRRADVVEERTLWVAELTVGTDRYAIPLSSLRAAVPLRLVRGIPLAPPWVIGVLRIEDRLVTAVSLAVLLGLEGRHGGWRDPEVLLVVERPDGGLIAIDSEGIPRPSALPYLEVEAARAATDGHGTARVILRRGEGDVEQIQLLDVERLVEGIDAS
jgi:purine-binding chemotaxis protein CheW